MHFVFLDKRAYLCSGSMGQISQLGQNNEAYNTLFCSRCVDHNSLSVRVLGGSTSRFDLAIGGSIPIQSNQLCGGPHRCVVVEHWRIKQ